MTSKLHRLSACHRHPATPVTGFCAFCLRDRLTGIQSPSAADHYYSPSLRRTKSFSASAAAAAAAVSEPRRRSCEVRLQSTLSNLFTVDDLSEKNQPNRSHQLEEEHNVEDVRVCIGRNEEETKTMKEFIDIELRNRKNSAARDSRSFWEVASVFSEKLKKWRWKNKSKKRRSFGGNGSRDENENKQRAWRLRETQSEFGRRSCDTDPRLSIDKGRISVVDDTASRISCDPYLIDMGRVSVDNDLRLSIDTYSRLYVDKGRISVDNDSRVSLDEPRASWDGCLMGKQCHRLPPMVPVEEDSIVGPDSRRRLDRLSSRRRQSMAEVDELRVTSNAKVSPATNELFYGGGAKLLISEKGLDLRNENVKSIISDVQGDCVMKGSASNDAPPDSDVVADKGFKKLHKWRGAWNKLNLAVHRNQKGECVAEDAVNNNPISESWQKLKRVVNEQQGSESISSCRNPCRMADLIKTGNVLNGRQEFMLQRKRSVSNLDNGLLRFYLMPLRNYRRSKFGKSSLKDLRPIARSVL